ncbi:hypothetical protein Syun_029703 [Stephania yunnanensis]|uniref:Protein kinase domain-containing protein n=1 Tax=Stephania yunnanensis TaxID=152371 RepID=A0AAP0EED7_9MAGN
MDLMRAITGDSIVLKFEKERYALEESLKCVEDIVQRGIGCQIFEEGSRPGSNGKAFERQLSKESSFNFRPSCRRSGQIPVPPDKLKRPISLQLMYDPIIISFATSTLKSLVEQSKYDPFSSQSQKLECEIQEKRRQMMVLEQRIVENSKASGANTSLVDMQKHSENKELEEKVLLLKHQLTAAMGKDLRNVPVNLVEENDGLHLEKEVKREDASYAKQVCHRDLKLDKTLLDGSPAPRLKICDFGYSKDNHIHATILIYLASDFEYLTEGKVYNISNFKVERNKLHKVGKLSNDISTHKDKVDNNKEYRRRVFNRRVVGVILLKHYPMAFEAPNQNNFASWRQNELERMALEQIKSK